MKRIILSLAVFALATSLGAADLKVNLETNAVVAGKDLKAGNYKLELDGDKALLKNGKASAEADVRVEEARAKYAKTTTCCLSTDGKLHLKEIRVGGTNTRILFKEKGQDAPAGN
ncbi:MAG: hypothetical protein HYZ37_02895 [Candidatus Solibacter usitatus]|nr:hypothetical protein [Candidatus Solibacter usitatus]